MGERLVVVLTLLNNFANGFTVGAADEKAGGAQAPPFSQRGKMKMTKTPMLDAFREGQEARKNGQNQYANPYDENQQSKRNAWIAGWMTEDRFQRKK